MDKTISLGLVIGAALGKSYFSTFNSAEQKVTRLGSALKNDLGQKDAIDKFAGLKKSVSATEAEMQAARQRVAALAREIKGTDKPTKTMTRDFDKAKRAAGQLKEKHARQRDALHRLRGELKSAGIDTNKLTSHNIRLGQSIDDTRHKLDRLNKAQAGQQAAAGRLAAMRGKALGMIGAVYGASRMVGRAFELEDKQNQLADVILGKDRQARLMASIKHAKAFARKSLASEGDVLEIDYALRSSGLEDKAAMFGSEIVSKVAAVTKGSASDVGFIIGDTFTNMGAMMEGSAKERLTRIGDVLTKTKNLFSIKDFNQLGEGLKEGLSGAIANNIPLEETAALIGQINNGMLKGSQAGTGLNAVLRQLPKAASEIGFEMIRDDKGALDVIATLEGLSEAIDGLGIDEAAMLLQEKFGDEGKKALVPLLGNMDALKRNLKEVREQSDGTFDEGYQRRMTSAHGQWTMMTQNVASVGATFANVLLPALNVVIRPLASLMGWVGEMLEEFPVISWMMGGIAAGFITYATVIGIATAAQWLWNTALMSSYVGLVKTGSSLLWTGAKLLWVEGVWAAGAVKVGVLTAAQWAWNAAMTANPVGLIVAGVAALAAGAYLLYKNWEPVMNWFSDKLDWLADKFSWVGDTWNSFFGGDTKQEPKPGKAKRTAAAAAAAATIMAATPATAQPTQPAQQSSHNYSISIQQQPGQSGADLAADMEREIARRNAARARSAMYDGGDY